MKITYFPDTDTELIELSDADVFESKEINENVYIDLDSKGRPVNITIEHAQTMTDVSEMVFRRATAARPAKR